MIQKSQKETTRWSSSEYLVASFWNCGFIVGTPWYWRFLIQKLAGLVDLWAHSGCRVPPGQSFPHGSGLVLQSCSVAAAVTTYCWGVPGPVNIHELFGSRRICHDLFAWFHRPFVMGWSPMTFPFFKLGNRNRRFNPSVVPTWMFLSRKPKHPRASWGRPWDSTLQAPSVPQLSQLRMWSNNSYPGLTRHGAAWGGMGLSCHSPASDVSQLVQVLWDEILTSIVLVARL